jgi:hypothetical protein
MRPGTTIVVLWAIFFPLSWIVLMAGLTEDGQPPRMLTVWVFAGAGVVIWVIGLVISIVLRTLIDWIDRRASLKAKNAQR